MRLPADVRHSPQPWVQPSCEMVSSCLMPLPRGHNVCQHQLVTMSTIKMEEI